MTIKPDLRLPEYKNREIINWGKLLLIMALIIYIGVLGFWYWSMEQDIAGLEAKLASKQNLEETLSQELDEYQDLQDQREKFELKSERLENLRLAHITWSQHLENLTDNTPTGVSIMEYDVTELDNVYISGSSESVLKAMLFVQELEENTAHNEVEIEFISDGGNEEMAGNYFFDLYAQLAIEAQEHLIEVGDESEEEEDNDAN